MPSNETKENKTWFKRLLRTMLFGRSPFGIFLTLNQFFWKRIPSTLHRSGLVRRYGCFLHGLVLWRGYRTHFHGTYFLRNRPQLELIQRLVDKKSKGDQLRVAVLGCSTGPEAYSVAWSIRSARPDLALVLTAADISEQAVDTAKLGVFFLSREKLSGTAVCEKLTPGEIENFFDRNGDAVTVKPWLKEGINWRVEDARDREITSSIGLQDLVVANNFLCHMNASEAETCLRNIVRLVNPDGYLIVSGIDLNVRARVARDLGWEPVEELLEEIHEGDILRNDWPFLYYGLEPLDKKMRNWELRYAAAFRIRKQRLEGQSKPLVAPALGLALS
jgi:SAM-dependent methyltransferase